MLATEALVENLNIIVRQPANTEYSALYLDVLEALRQTVHFGPGFFGDRPFKLIEVLVLICACLPFFLIYMTE